MLRFVLKYIKPYAIMCVSCIALLFLQAQMNLTLPDYMAKIVNVGIQNNGVEEMYPKALPKNTFQLLELVADEKQKMWLQQHFYYLDYTKATENELSKYPILKNESIYIYDEKSNEIEESMIVNYMLVQMLQNIQDPNVYQLLPKPLQKELSMIHLDQNKGNISYEIIKNLSNSTILTMKKQINQELKGLGTTNLQSVGTTFIQSEYKKMGLDLQHIQQSYIFKIGLQMLLISFIGGFAAIVVGLFAAKIAASISRDLRKDVFRKVESLSYQDFNQFSTSSLITRNTNDIQQIQLVIVMILRIVVYAPLLGVGALMKVLSTQSTMSWIIDTVLILLVILVMFMFIFVVPKFKKAQLLLDRLNSVIREFLNGMSVVRAFQNEAYEENKFEEANRSITKMNLFINRVMAFMMPCMMFIMNGVGLVIIWVGGHQIDAGSMQIGDMMAFLQYTMQIIMAFLMISMVSVMIPRAIVSLIRIREVITYQQQLKEEQCKAFEHFEKPFQLEFSHVNFCYPNGQEAVLKDINFQIKEKEVVAIIGSTGSGKSTLINLIPRLYDVTSGVISINGQNIKEIYMNQLNDMIAFVPQKALLFSGTIASNLAYGNKNATEAMMEEACSIAQAKEFIEQKDLRYEEAIAQGGSNVSGGQRQRLAIARAIMKKARLLIFDDSFSALDYKTDARLRKELQKLVEKESTAILIVAQRIRSIMHADKIIVLDDGRIEAIGTHDQLMKTSVVYQEIAQSQLSKEED